MQKRFGEKLNMLRKRHGLTLRELASALGYASHSYLGELEIGQKRPSLELAVKISEFFNIPLDKLAKDEIDLDSFF